MCVSLSFSGCYRNWLNQKRVKIPSSSIRVGLPRNDRHSCASAKGTQQIGTILKFPEQASCAGISVRSNNIQSNPGSKHSRGIERLLTDHDLVNQEIKVDDGATKQRPE